jgi:hypothetical protein
MFCGRLCAVDDFRCAFPPLSGVSGDDAQNIIDRLRSMFACSLIQDAAGPSGVEAAGGQSELPVWCVLFLCSNACRREVIPLRGVGFDRT